MPIMGSHREGSDGGEQQPDCQRVRKNGEYLFQNRNVPTNQHPDLDIFYYIYVCAYDGNKQHNSSAVNCNCKNVVLIT